MKNKTSEQFTKCVVCMYIEYRKILKHNPMDKYILSSIMRAGAEFMRVTVATINTRT